MVQWLWMTMIHRDFLVGPGLLGMNSSVDSYEWEAEKSLISKPAILGLGIGRSGKTGSVWKLWFHQHSALLLGNNWRIYWICEILGTMSLWKAIWIFEMDTSQIPWFKPPKCFTQVSQRQGGWIQPPFWAAGILQRRKSRKWASPSLVNIMSDFPMIFR